MAENTTTATATYTVRPVCEWVPTTVLHVGDVVWTHGMQVALMEVCYDGTDERGRCINFRGQVLNAAELLDAGQLAVPAHWLVGSDGLGNSNRYADEWHVQGNSYATWMREIDGTEADVVCAAGTTGCSANHPTDDECQSF